MTDAAARPHFSDFRRRMKNGDPLIGTFIKTPTGHATEIIGGLGFDFVVIDEEHAPFDRGSIDATLLSARAANIAGIVRVASAHPASILSALDCGATGVLVPHVASPDMARQVVAACRYETGHRGFSGSPRAGGYGERSLWEHVEQSDAEIAVVGMIEDPEAIDAIDEIVATDGLDAVFIGRGDLTVAFGAGARDTDTVKKATEKVAAAARRADKAIFAMTPGGEDAAWLRSLGVSGMIVSSDQGFMRQAANKALAEFRELVS